MKCFEGSQFSLERTVSPTLSQRWIMGKWCRLNFPFQGFGYSLAEQLWEWPDDWGSRKPRSPAWQRSNGSYYEGQERNYTGPSHRSPCDRTSSALQYDNSPTIDVMTKVVGNFLLIPIKRSGWCHPKEPFSTRVSLVLSQDGLERMSYELCWLVFFWG